MILQGRGQDADLGQLVRKDLGVFDVGMEDAILELVDRTDVVHLHPEHVGGIVVQTEVLGGDRLEHSPPDRGAEGQVLSPGPLIA